MNPSPEITRHRVFVHRQTGELVEVAAPPGALVRNRQGLRTVSPDRVGIFRVAPSGSPAKATRYAETNLAAFREAYTPYRPCRWELLCAAQAVVTVRWNDPGGDHPAAFTKAARVSGHEIDACGDHAAEHAAWEAKPDRDRYDEPGPDCWCPDLHRRRGHAVDYCARHGKGPGRGVEMTVQQLGVNADAPIDLLVPAVAVPA